MKRILSILLLSLMIVSYVAPFLGHKEIKTKPPYENIVFDNTELLFSMRKNMSLEVNLKNESTKETEETFVGYTTENVNVRVKPTTDSAVYCVIMYNTPIEYRKYNEDWYVINMEGMDKYISSKYISDVQINYKDYGTPSDNSFKSYMDYRCITDKTSKQWELQLFAYTDSNGIRMIDNRMCIAMGTGYNVEVGDCVDLYMQNGSVVQCIIADIKADKHTDSTNRQNSNGSIVEFVVDENKLHKNIAYHGDLSYALEILYGEIETVRVYQ